MVDTSRQARSALGRALLAYVAFMVLLITWSPFRFSLPSQVTLMWGATWSDIVLNIVLFLPLGFLFTASATKSHQARLKWIALLAGLLFSAFIEAGQILLEHRYTSPWDVLTNGLGAYVGALAQLHLARGLSQRLPGHPALELPLMNLLYLLTVLLWLNGLAALAEPYHAFLAPPLAVFGVVILSAVWRYRFAAAFTRHQVTSAAALWYFVATATVLSTAPIIVLSTTCGVAALTWLLTGRTSSRDDDERRFEIPVLRRAAPFFAAYFIALSLWPLGLELDMPRAVYHLSGLDPDPTIPQIFGVLEGTVAFTILGFMVAEWRGRTDESLARTVGRVVTVAASSTVLFQLLRGLRPNVDASLAEGLIHLLAALAGLILYQRQLAALRAWLDRPDRGDALTSYLRDFSEE